MKLSELKTGMVVVNSKGSAGVVLKGTKDGDLIKWFRDVNTGKVLQLFRSLWTINEDLTFKDGTGRIVQIYQAKDKHECTTVDAVKPKNLIWEEKTKEVTMAEVEKKFGCKVKIKR